MAYETLQIERREKVALVTLNRPPYNPLNPNLYRELFRACEELERDRGVKVVVFTGAGKAFSTGLDVKEVEGKSSVEMREIVDLARLAYCGVEGLSRPTIAAINGMALGGGLELALCCDFRFASEEATFGQPEINLGIAPGGGGTQRLPRLIGPSKAKELLFTGETIGAQRALELGLVDRVFPPGELMEQTIAFAQKMAQKPLVALQALKTAVERGLEMSLDAALVFEGECFLMAYTSEDGREGLRAFTERRKPDFKDR